MQRQRDLGSDRVGLREHVRRQKNPPSPAEEGAQPFPWCHERSTPPSLSRFPRPSLVISLSRNPGAYEQGGLCPGNCLQVKRIGSGWQNLLAIPHRGPVSGKFGDSPAVGEKEPPRVISGPPMQESQGDP